MQLTVLTGRANRLLAESVASILGVELGGCTIEDFPDGEIQIEVQEDLRGRDIYLIQPTSPPVSEHLLELLLIADASIRNGAARVTAIIPYFGYARQDRRVHGNEPVGARLIADLLCTRFGRIVTIDLHNPSIEGFFTIPVEHLSAVPLLSEALRSSLSKDQIIVAPDLGAVKLAQRYADIVKLPVAYIHKIRLSGKEVSVRRVIGDVRNRSPIVIDDMISTGGTMISAMEALLNGGCQPKITIAASHTLLVGDAVERLSSFPIQTILATDSVDRPSELPLPIKVVSLKHLLAETIIRLHGDHP